MTIKNIFSVLLFSLNITAQTNLTTPQKFHFDNYVHLITDEKQMFKARKEIVDIESQAKIDTIIYNTDSSKWSLKFYTTIGWNEPTPLKRQNTNLVYVINRIEDTFTTNQILEEFQIKNFDSTQKDGSELFPRGHFQIAIISKQYLILKFINRYLHGNQRSGDSTETFYFEKITM